jgi:hypothetical protein
VDSAKDHLRATLARHAAEGVATQGIGRVDPDADDVAG